MNKKIMIGGGVAALFIGAVVGAYYYTKKTIKKIVAAMDDTFNIEDGYIYEQKDEEINGQKIHIESVYPKDESKRTAAIVHGHIEPYPIIDKINEIKEQLQLKKCEDCPYKNKNQFTYPAWWGIYPPYGGEADGIPWIDNVDDKWFRDHINTVNLFDGDDRK